MSMCLKTLKSRVLFLGCLVFFGSSVYADSLNVTQTVSGPTGLVEMPTARMFPEGEFSIHYSQALPYGRYSITGQPLPWLQVLFKYTDIGYKDYPASKGKQNFKDKSTDIKVRLIKEDYYWPEVSVGINDVGGTGIFSGEYLALSKQFKRLDFTFGVGWGYLGSRGMLKNPLTYISDSFLTRPGRTKYGGTVNPLNFFSGEDISLYAGAEYHLDSLPMSLKLEYDANDYQSEPFDEQLDVASPFNISASYSYNKHVDFHLGVVRGNELSLGLTLRTNLSSKGPPKILDEQPVALYDSVLNPNPENKTDTIDWSKVKKKLNENSGFDVANITQQNEKVFLTGQHKLFSEKAKGIGRAARILSNELPDSVKQLVFVDAFNGVDVSAIELDRVTFDKAAKLEIDQEEVLETSKFLPHAEYGLTQSNISNSNLLYRDKKPEFDYFLAPSFSGSLGGPEAFLLYQLGYAANANYYLRENTWLSGAVELGLADNFEEFVYAPSDKLHRVRTNIKAYLKTSQIRMPRLQLSDLERLGDDFFLLSYAGYFESMYGGLGAELMYRPNGEDWALGFDANYAKQRDFDQGLGFKEYSVLTGHLTGFYETDDNVLFKLSAGRYLAKDIGLTLDISRKFKNGAELGVWATGTNVSAKDFSEGSFDKGFYLTIPMDLFTFKSTAETAKFNWQFLTRDGGQKLKKKYELYDITSSRSLDFVKDSFEKVLH